MRRPAFQFYPADWLGDTKLRRCSHAERGIWIDVLCLMHDGDEYGILRWTLAELARAVGCTVNGLRGLVDKGLMKGSDDRLDKPLIYTPRSGRRNGEPVRLLEVQAGPIWFSSRMVRDEYVRQHRGEMSRFASDTIECDASPIRALKASPKPPFGVGSSSSSSSSSTSASTPSSKNTSLPPQVGNPMGFTEFWKAWPPGPRKVAEAKCFGIWESMGLEQFADRVIAALEVAKVSHEWTKDDGVYVPRPMTWLSESRWEALEQRAMRPLPSWVTTAGFDSVGDAETAGCGPGNFSNFRDGQRVKEPA